MILYYPTQNADTVPITRWNTRYADWDKYAQTIQTKLLIPTESDTEIDIHVENLTNIITQTATESIGVKTTGRKKTVPWWNSECHESNKQFKKALNKYRKHKTEENFIEMKKCKSKNRKTIV